MDNKRLIEQLKFWCNDHESINNENVQSKNQTIEIIKELAKKLQYEKL